MIAELVLIGNLVVTAYQPIPAQTRDGCRGVHDCFTANGDVPTKYGVAVSQDLLKSGRLHYGEPIYVEGIGWKIVNDCMNARYKNRIDIMVWTHDAEKKIGTRHVRVYHVCNEKACLLNKKEN